MNENPATATAPHELDTVAVVLLGGPPSLPPELHPRRVPAGTEKVKIPYGAGHEHFERETPATPGEAAPVVFRWTGRTRIAE